MRSSRTRNDGEGRLRDALRSYQRVIDHAQGDAYAEEALLRQAHLHVDLDEISSALTKLAAGERRFAGGALAPERSALEARLHMKAGRIQTAARALERVPDAASSLAIARMRVEVAEALLEVNPARARRLATPVLRTPDAGLRQRAAALTSAQEATKNIESAPGAPKLD